MAVITMKQLLEAGVHFGHQTRKVEPQDEKVHLRGEKRHSHHRPAAHRFGLIEAGLRVRARKPRKRAKPCCFVGTKKQAQDAIKEEAERCGQYYINSRWLGGYAHQLQDHPFEDRPSQ